jgi:hypothetical protein
MVFLNERDCHFESSYGNHAHPPESLYVTRAYVFAKAAASDLREITRYTVEQ